MIFGKQLRTLEKTQARRIFDLIIIGAIFYLLDFLMPQELGGQTIILRTAGMLIFLYGYGLLGLVSGLIGVTIGAGIAILISSLGDFPMAIKWTSLAIGLVFGVLTTTIAGVYPANKAARLDPVEALRAE